MSTIYRVHFEGVDPVKETLPYDNMPAAVEATLRDVRKTYRHVEVQRMAADYADIWACNDPKWPNFGQGYYLHIEA